MYKKKVAKETVEKKVRVKRVPKVRPGKPEIESVPLVTPPVIEYSTNQLELIDITRRRLWGNQIYKLNLESLPTKTMIERMGMDAAVEQLYLTSNYWEQVLR